MIVTTTAQPPMTDYIDQQSELMSELRWIDKKAWAKDEKR